MEVLPNEEIELNMSETLNMSGTLNMFGTLGLTARRISPPEGTPHLMAWAECGYDGWGFQSLAPDSTRLMYEQINKDTVLFLQPREQVEEGHTVTIGRWSFAEREIPKKLVVHSENGSRLVMPDETITIRYGEFGPEIMEEGVEWTIENQVIEEQLPQNTPPYSTRYGIDTSWDMDMVEGQPMSYHVSSVERDRYLFLPITSCVPSGYQLTVIRECESENRLILVSTAGTYELRAGESVTIGYADSPRPTDGRNVWDENTQESQQEYTTWTYELECPQCHAEFDAEATIRGYMVDSDGYGLNFTCRYCNRACTILSAEQQA